MIKNPENHSATNHIETRYLYARSIYEQNRINIEYCPTEDMIADTLTKALNEKQFIKLESLFLFDVKLRYW